VLTTLAVIVVLYAVVLTLARGFIALVDRWL
jgi:hypothetical protein